MVLRIALVVLGAFHVLNGIWMLAAPDLWFVSIPGVTTTGPMNHHFIADIGMAFLTSGGLLIVGARSGARSAMLAVAGAVWPALHALVHIEVWFMHGFPTSANVAASEAVGVVGLAALGVALAWFRVRGE